MQNRVVGFAVYQATVSTDEYDASVDLIASLLEEAYLKLESADFKRSEIVDIFIAKPEPNYAYSCDRPYPLLDIR